MDSYLAARYDKFNKSGDPSVHYAPVVSNFMGKEGKIGVINTGDTSLQAFEDLLRIFPSTHILNKWENSKNS